METKRKLEEAERKRQEEEDLKAAVVLQVINNDFNIHLLFIQYINHTNIRLYI